jgi:hypothetical protein
VEPGGNAHSIGPTDQGKHRRCRGGPPPSPMFTQLLTRPSANRRNRVTHAGTARPEAPAQPHQIAPPTTQRERPGEVEGLVPELPRALRALALGTVITEDAPHPVAELKPSRPGGSVVVLSGRATRVPQAAVASGIQRTITVTRTGPLGWAPVPDLRWGRSPKLHGMQGVRTRILWTRWPVPSRSAHRRGYPAS